MFIYSVFGVGWFECCILQISINPMLSTAPYRKPGFYLMTEWWGGSWTRIVEVLIKRGLGMELSGRAWPGSREFPLQCNNGGGERLVYPAVPGLVQVEIGHPCPSSTDGRQAPSHCQCGRGHVYCIKCWLTWRSRRNPDVKHTNIKKTVSRSLWKAPLTASKCTDLAEFEISWISSQGFP